MKAKKEAQSARRMYAADEREKILSDAEALGVCATARKHGIPQPTISGWRRAHAAESGAKVVGAAAKIAVASSTRRAGAEEATGAAPPAAEPAAKPSARKQPARRYTPSQKAQALEHAAAAGVSVASRELGISRFALHQWQRELDKAAQGECPSPASGPAPSEIEAHRDREILGEWHKHAGLGPSQIRNQLRRRGVKVSVSTVRRVMQDAGYRPPKIKRTPHDQRYESVRPNHRWHLDFVHRHIHRASTFTLALLDDHSRFVVGHGVDDAERADFVIHTFEQAVAHHGKPERVMSDRGAAFWSWRGVSRFTALLEKMEIEQEIATDKELNGKIEVFNANLHKEFFDVQRYYDVAEMKRRLAAHLHFYNHGRTHHALGGLLVPADRYYGRAEQVLARIEAGATRQRRARATRARTRALQGGQQKRRARGVAPRAAPERAARHVEKVRFSPRWGSRGVCKPTTREASKAHPQRTQPRCSPPCSDSSCRSSFPHDHRPAVRHRHRFFAACGHHYTTR